MVQNASPQTPAELANDINGHPLKRQVQPPGSDRFPPFGGLKAFYEVALTGSAVGASERLGVTASSISHQLKALEHEFGVRLIENTKGRLHLTPDGAQFYEHIRRPMAEILRASDMVRSGPGHRRVSLTLTPSFAVGWLLPRLTAFDRQHPDLEITLITTTRVVDLARENVDLAIRRGSGHWKGMHADHLLKENIVPVIAPGLFQELGCDTLDAALRKTRALVNTTVKAEWDDWSGARGITPPSDATRYNLETYELTVQAARDGLGIALGRRPLLDEMIEAGELLAPFAASQGDDTGYFVVRRDEPMNSDAKRLHAWLLSQGA